MSFFPSKFVFDILTYIMVSSTVHFFQIKINFEEVVGILVEIIFILLQPLFIEQLVDVTVPGIKYIRKEVRHSLCPHRAYN